MKPEDGHSLGEPQTHTSKAEVVAVNLGLYIHVKNNVGVVIIRRRRKRRMSRRIRGRRRSRKNM